MARSTGDEWLGTSAAAAFLGINLRLLYKLVDLGHVPAYKMGRVIRIKASDLEAYLEANRVEPGSLKHLYPERVEGE